LGQDYQIAVRPAKLWQNCDMHIRCGNKLEIQEGQLMKETTPTVAASEESERLFFADIADILKSGRVAA